MRLTILTVALVALTPPPEQLFAQAMPPGVDPGVVKRRFDPPLRPDPELYRCLEAQRKLRAMARKDKNDNKQKPASTGRPSHRDDDGKNAVCPVNTNLQ